MNKIGIILPAFNEEKNIKIVIKEAEKYFPEAKIIVVDDGSKDKTSEIAKKEKVIVLKHKINKGKGESLKTGLSYISGKLPKVNFVLVMDADTQYSAKSAKKLLSPLIKNKADFVMGYRNWSRIPFRHRMGNFVWKNLFNLLFKTSLKDTNCGLIALSRETIGKMKISGGYVVENSMLASAIKNNLRIEQVLIEVNYRKVSPVLRGIRVVLGVLFFIIKEGVKYRLRIT